jgi:hypothetical protein
MPRRVAGSRTVRTNSILALRPSRAARDRWLVPTLLIAGAVNLVVLLAQLPGLVRSLYENADSATALVLADGLGASHDASRVVTLGHYHYYEAWLLEKATAGLPDHWQLWEAIPFVIAFVGIALMVWAAWRALGAFAALLAGVVMVALGDEMREVLFTPDTHGYFVVHAALLAGALVFVADRASRGRLTWQLLVGVGVPLAALSTLGATDQLFEFVALPSFALAGCLGWWRHPGADQRNIAFFCIAVCGVSIVGCQLLDSAMIENGVVSQLFPLAFVGAEALLSNVQVAVTAVAYLGGGSFWGAPVKGTQLLVFAVGALALVGVGALLRFLWRYASSLRVRERTTSGPRDVYLAFWMFVVALSLLVFTLSSLPDGLATARYLPGVFAGSAALLPTLMGSSTASRVSLATAVATFATLVATNHLIEGTPAGLGPSRSASYDILNYVRAEDAAHGYAPYWDASVMAWQTRGALKVYPAIPYGPGLHPFPFNQISTWYTPVSGVRTFLVSDSRPVPESFTTAPAPLGKPVSVAVFGSYTVDIYDHDIAEDLG